jgi:hypothetical protein
MCVAILLHYCPSLVCLVGMTIVSSTHPVVWIILCPLAFLALVRALFVMNLRWEDEYGNSREGQRLPHQETKIQKHKQKL